MNKEKTPAIVPLTIATAVTIVIWVFFDLYHNFTQKNPPVVPPQIIAPLDPKLDIETLNQVGSRTFSENVELTILATPTPAIEELSTPTPSATSSATPTNAASPTPTTVPDQD